VGAKGLAFLDCPISGTSGMVAGGDGIIFVGGEQRVFDRWRPVLEAVLPRAIYVGRPGQAMTLKLVANLLVALNSAAAAEALLMARRAGLDLELVLDVLTRSAATSRMLEVRGPLMARQEFPPQMKLDLFMKDLHLIQDAARVVQAPASRALCARPRLWGPWAKTWVVWATPWAASDEASLYVCSGGTYGSSAVCQRKNGGDAGVTRVSSEVARRDSGVASSPSRIRRAGR